MKNPAELKADQKVVRAVNSAQEFISQQSAEWRTDPRNRHRLDGAEGWIVDTEDGRVSVDEDGHFELLG